MIRWEIYQDSVEPHRIYVIIDLIKLRSLIHHTMKNETQKYFKSMIRKVDLLLTEDDA